MCNRFILENTDQSDAHGAVFVFFLLEFQSPDGAFLAVKANTGLPALLKQLAQLQNVNKRHRDTSRLTATQRNTKT